MPLKPHPTDPDKMVYVKREYILPKEWVGLTDEEVKILATQGRTDFSRPMYNEFYSAIEAKLKEKNT